jgi:hypothetical protein
MLLIKTMPCCSSNTVLPRVVTVLGETDIPGQPVCIVGEKIGRPVMQIIFLRTLNFMP